MAGLVWRSPRRMSPPASPPTTTLLDLPPRWTTSRGTWARNDLGQRSRSRSRRYATRQPAFTRRLIGTLADGGDHGSARRVLQRRIRLAMSDNLAERILWAAFDRVRAETAATPVELAAELQIPLADVEGLLAAQAAVGRI